MSRDTVEDSTSASLEKLFSNYDIDDRYFDEMFLPNSEPRIHCQAFWNDFKSKSVSEIAALQERVERSFLYEGITFAVYGEQGAQERIIPIDLFPRIVSAEDWRFIERGVKQRLKALNMFIGDIYGARQILSDGVIPEDQVLGCPQFLVQMQGVKSPHGSFVSICGSDIVRTRDGFMVLEDNLRVPSGASYMLANRQAIKSSLREQYRRNRVRGIDNYGQMLRATLAEMSPSGNADPCIVLLTPGVYNSAFYEHMLLAREMGVELVQGLDLVVHNAFVYMRTTEGLRKVDVIYRRIDDDFIDPLVFREDSMLGVPGLFYVHKMGNVTIANSPGTGIADDKSVYAYIPNMIRYYLSEVPILSNVETYLCRKPEDLEYTLDNLDKLVVKIVGGSGGYDMLVGPHSSPAERAAYAEKIRQDPANFIAQPTLDLSRSPCLSENGSAPRHVDLRVFLLQGQNSRLIPGAFCRVALTPGSLVVNSSQGGGGKDVWVLAS